MNPLPSLIALFTNHWIWAVIGIVATALVLYFFSSLHLLILAAYPHIGPAYLWLCELIAASLGAPITPIPPGWAPPYRLMEI